MSKHAAVSKRVHSWFFAAAVIGGFLLIGVVVFLVATAPTDPDPLDQEDIVVGAPSSYVLMRATKAEAASRDAVRLDRKLEREKQARIEARKEKRREAREEARAARQAEREAAREAATSVVVPAPTPTSTGSGTPSGGSGSLPPLLQLIRSHESGGNYGAYNGGGCEGYGCYGAYQMHGRYMADWARRYGAGSYAGTPANQWPPAVQDKVALGLFYSTNPDGAHWCNWTTYC